MNTDTLIEFITISTEGMATIDQVLFACALFSPFCGIVIAATLSLSSRNPLRWLVAWFAPLIWSTSLGFLLSQLTPKEYLLLVASYLISLAATLVYYLVLSILSIGSLFDWLVYLGKRFLSKNNAS